MSKINTPSHPVSDDDWLALRGDILERDIILPKPKIVRISAWGGRLDE